MKKPLLTMLFLIVLSMLLISCNEREQRKDSKDSREADPTVVEMESDLKGSTDSDDPSDAKEEGVNQLTDFTEKEKPIVPLDTGREPLDAFEQTKKLGRGVNFGNALEAPREGEWGLVIQEPYFHTIQEGGFDTVRVPIKWSNHALEESPYTIDEKFFERIDWVVDNALEQNLNVVINVHHYQELYKKPLGEEERFLTIWRQIAERYKNKPEQVYLELLNEPNGGLSWLKWNKLLAKTLEEVRGIDPYHTIIIGSAGWNSINDLKHLKIPEEEQNVIATFHFYDPFLFTHQGAEWVGKEIGTTGVNWPGPPAAKKEPNDAANKVDWVKKWFNDYYSLPYETNPAGPMPLVEQLDKAERWGKDNNRPMWMGEFGAYSKGDMKSRANWTAFVREEAEKRGFSWAYWEFAAGFGVYDKNLKRWRQELHEALIPKP